MDKEVAAKPAARRLKPHRRGVWIIVLVAVLLGGYVALSLFNRQEKQSRLASWTRERAIPYVSIVHPHADPNPQSLSLPGSISAWYEASIHAQVSGYIKSWSKDIGALVKKDEVLAIVDTPELDERLSEAREQLLRANAALQLAKVTSERWAALRNSSAVSKQSADEKASDEIVRQADVGAASANLDRLKAQKAFARIVAPFDGVVTARNIDIGAYVSPSQSGEPAFRVADVHEVRVYVQAPQVYSAQIKRGMKATFTTPQWPNRVFTAEVTTTSNAIGAQTGSLLVELDTPNSDNALFPGSFATVTFELPVDPSHLRIASSALSFDEHGMRVATVNADNRVAFKKIVIAKDFGAEVSVGSGLSTEDRVINNPPETLAEGDEVRIGGGTASAAK